MAATIASRTARVCHHGCVPNLPNSEVRPKHILSLGGEFPPGERKSLNFLTPNSNLCGFLVRGFVVQPISLLRFPSAKISQGLIYEVFSFKGNAPVNIRCWPEAGQTINILIWGSKHIWNRRYRDSADIKRSKPIYILHYQSTTPSLFLLAEVLLFLSFSLPVSHTLSLCDLPSAAIKVCLSRAASPLAMTRIMCCLRERCEHKVPKLY